MCAHFTSRCWTGSGASSRPASRPARMTLAGIACSASRPGPPRPCDTTRPAGPDADPASRGRRRPTYVLGVADVALADLLSINAAAPGRDVQIAGDRPDAQRLGNRAPVVRTPAAGGTVSLASLPASEASLVIDTSVRADGSFRLASVPSGDYLLTALGAGATSGAQEAAVERLPVGGDLQALCIVAGPGGANLRRRSGLRASCTFPQVEDVLLMLEAIEFDGCPTRSSGRGSAKRRLRDPWRHGSLSFGFASRSARGTCGALSGSAAHHRRAARRLTDSRRRVALSNRLPAIQGTVRDGEASGQQLRGVRVSDRSKLRVAASRAIGPCPRSCGGVPSGRPAARHFFRGRDVARGALRRQRYSLLKRLACSAERLSLSEGSRETLVLEFR